MKAPNKFFTTIRKLIAKDEISQALVQLKTFFDNTSKLDEVILQSSRFEAVRKHIRQGSIKMEEQNVELNKIKAGLLELLSTVEEESKHLTWGEEVRKTAKIIIQQAPKIYNIDHIDNANFS